MKSKYIAWLLLLHAVLLVAASTHWTIVSWLWGKAWTWNYVTMRYANGWGHVYRSRYSLPTVWTYLLAYGIGLLAYRKALRCRGGGRFLAGGTLCLLGLVSFSIELSHWLLSHHLSAIVTCSVASLVLAATGIVQFMSREGQVADSPEAPGVLPASPPEES